MAQPPLVAVDRVDLVQRLVPDREERLERRLHVFQAQRRARHEDVAVGSGQEAIQRHGGGAEVAAAERVARHALLRAALVDLREGCGQADDQRQPHPDHHAQENTTTRGEKASST